MIDELMQGALGGVVLIDTARITESWNAMERMEEAGLPYAIAVNTFADSSRYSEAELRQALDLHTSTPLVERGARHSTSAKKALIALVSHLLSRLSLEPAS